MEQGLDTLGVLPASPSPIIGTPARVRNRDYPNQVNKLQVKYGERKSLDKALSKVAVFVSRPGGRVSPNLFDSRFDF